jgi:hypothetical protein
MPDGSDALQGRCPACAEMCSACEQEPAHPGETLCTDCLRQKAATRRLFRDLDETETDHA